MENKVYLNTVEEIVGALQKGETVYEEDNNGKVQTKYYIYNGLIISEWKESGDKFINSGSLLVKKNRYFCYRKKPIKIEVGKFYKNKSGDKCVCVYESDDRKYQNRFLMVIIDALPERNKYCVDEEGKVDDYKSNPYNIVDYWDDN